MSTPRLPDQITYTAPPGTPACLGRSYLFDSIRHADGREAVAICRTCPVLDWCKDHARRVRVATYDSNGGRPVGTWAGRFNGSGRPISFKQGDEK